MADSSRRQKRAGLSSSEAEASRREHGANVLSGRKTKTFIRRFFENLGDPVIRILLIALGVNLIFVFRGGDILETVGIGISVFLAAFISALSESGGENAFRRLSGECEKQSVRVWRDGELCTLPIEEIVVGDRVVIGAGERIPADCYAVEGEVSVDQSAITGESKEIKKSPASSRRPYPDEKNTLLRGCPVLGGKCVGEVFAVGDESFLGRISLEVQTDTRESPLKLRLAKLAGQISRLGTVAAVLISFAYLFNCFIMDSGFEWSLVMIKLKDLPFLAEKLLHAFMLGLTVLVVAVPEGLPMMIAVVLSSNIKRMVRDQVLVRKPVGIEAAGSMNILFTDKTGTLTEGKMTVCSAVLCDGQTVNDVKILQKQYPQIGKLYALSARFNTASDLTERGAVGGNGTDRALLNSALCLPQYSVSLEGKLPFDSAYKFSAARIKDGKRAITLIKGAPEKLLPYVTRCVMPDGTLADFSALRQPIVSRISAFAEDGKRVLVIAMTDDTVTYGHIPPLTLICAVCLGDPMRRSAPASVRALRQAGIGVVMITGDARPTASSIARSCGIIGGERDTVLDGAELSRLTDAELEAVLPRLAVVCRALPSDKSRLVRIAQRLELVVGMTGDGINDAPALKLADIGFAMGGGTDVAKDAGDIIILDNDLASIVKAVLYGRNIFKSIRKFITLQLTMNFCAVGVSMIGPFIGIDAPVTVVQMLWINIIMDTLGGLAFAGESPSPLCMKEKPKRRDEPILNRYMVDQIVLLGGFTVALCLFFLLSPSVASRFRYSSDGIYLLTAFFALFIFTSVLNCFNCRCDRMNMLSGISGNPTFIIIMLLILAIQLVFVYLGGSVLRTIPLIPSELIYTMLLSFTVIPFEFIRRTLWRIRGKKNGF